MQQGAPVKASSAPWWIVAVLGGLLLLTVPVIVILVIRASASDRTPAPAASGGGASSGASPIVLLDAQAPGVPPTAANALASAAVDASANATANANANVPLTAAELDALPGNYTCKMDDTPAFACRIAGGRLEKLAGSQRFKGPITKLANGDLAFTGTFFCPFGDCTHPVATTFVRRGPGRYIGKFGPNAVPGGGPGGERVVLNKVR
jgi:hypothetical protein